MHVILRSSRARGEWNFLRRAHATRVKGLTHVTARRFGVKLRRFENVGKFWDALAYSRVVERGRDYLNLLEYLRKNQWEADGVPRDQVDHWIGVKKQLLRAGIFTALAIANSCQNRE